MVRIGNHEVAGMHIGTGAAAPSVPAPNNSTSNIGTSQAPKPVSQTPVYPQGPTNPAVMPGAGGAQQQ